MKSRMKRFWITCLVTGLMFGSASASWALTRGQQTLLAERAAKVDAYRNMAERVKGLKVDSTTCVRDFVAEHDEVNTELNTYIQGLKVVDTKFYDDGTCEVTIEMTIEELVKRLQTWEKRYPWGKSLRFDQITYYNKITVLRESGRGSPRPTEPAPATYGGERVQTGTLSSPTSGVPGWENVMPQGRLMAERAAKVDAYRNLAEFIYGLKIDSQTNVRDFVAENDQVRTQMEHFVQGARVVPPYRYFADGIVECDLEITLQDVIVELQRIHKRMVEQGYHWTRVTNQTLNFERIVDFCPERIVRAKGSGTVPEKYMGAAAPRAQAAAPSAPDWAGQVISASGQGIPPAGATGPEARLMAERAAKMDAMRNLSEKVNGVKITSQTTVHDFAVSRDEIQAEINNYMAGAKASEPKYLSDGSCEVTVELALDGIWNVVRKYKS